MQDNRTAALLNVAMSNPEELVCQIVYLDERGDATERIVSPIRYLTRALVSVYCLGREEPRTLRLGRILRVRIALASDVLAPEAIRELCSHRSKRAKAAGTVNGNELPRETRAPERAASRSVGLTENDRPE